MVQGTYHAQPGLKRYRCKEQGCKRTFNDLTGTLLDGSKRSVMHWILATFLLCLSCASRRIAKELGVHVRTGYRWCWWLRNAALSYEIGRQLNYSHLKWEFVWEPLEAVRVISYLSNRSSKRLSSFS
jgi:transposase-like protein